MKEIAKVDWLSLPERERRRITGILPSMSVNRMKQAKPEGASEKTVQGTKTGKCSVDQPRFQFGGDEVK